MKKFKLSFKGSEEKGEAADVIAFLVFMMALCVIAIFGAALFGPGKAAPSTPTEVPFIEVDQNVVATTRSQIQTEQAPTTTPIPAMENKTQKCNITGKAANGFVGAALYEDAAFSKKTQNILYPDGCAEVIDLTKAYQTEAGWRGFAKIVYHGFDGREYWLDLTYAEIQP
ncbi:MAG: hypothetical protein AAB443_04290 [Patescibacteria group bacterium]